MRLGQETKNKTTMEHVFSQAATLVASQRTVLALYKIIQTK